MSLDRSIRSPARRGNPLARGQRPQRLRHVSNLAQCGGMRAFPTITRTARAPTSASAPLADREEHVMSPARSRPRAPHPGAGLPATVAALALALPLAGCLGSGEGGGSAVPPMTASTTTTTTAATSPPPGAAPPAPPAASASTMPAAQPTTAADAVRFLEQAAFGPNDTAIQEVMTKGPALALEEQFAKTMSG